MLLAPSTLSILLTLLWFACAGIRECRRQALLAYFNDSMTGACEGCDNCDRLAARSASAAANGPVIRGALTIDEYSDAVRMVSQCLHGASTFTLCLNRDADV
jgi:superfamily II DNA helicase RecQ